MIHEVPTPQVNSPLFHTVAAYAFLPLTESKCEDTCFGLRTADRYLTLIIWFSQFCTSAFNFQKAIMPFVLDQDNL